MYGIDISGLTNMFYVLERYMIGAMVVLMILSVLGIALRLVFAAYFGPLGSVVASMTTFLLGAIVFAHYDVTLNVAYLLAEKVIGSGGGIGINVDGFVNGLLGDIFGSFL
ncbi:MAG: hypothetical protein K6U04_08625 [Armatimonadetes bacterium]|nr:hypothetical protein [Armatimonadota bacterium]